MGILAHPISVHRIKRVMNIKPYALLFLSFTALMGCASHPTTIPTTNHAISWGLEVMYHGGEKKIFTVASERQEIPIKELQWKCAVTAIEVVEHVSLRSISCKKGSDVILSSLGCTSSKKGEAVMSLGDSEKNKSNNFIRLTCF